MDRRHAGRSHRLHVGRLDFLAWAVVASALACRTDAVPGPDLLVLTVLTEPGVTRVVARVAPEERPKPLRSSPSGTEFMGSLAVKPGPQILTVETYDRRERLAGTLTARVEVTHGDPAQVIAFVPGASFSAGPAPLIEVLASPRSSVVAGAKVKLNVVVRSGAGETASHWSATPEGCGSFEPPTSTSTSFTPIAAGACTMTLAVKRGQQVERRSLSIVVRSRARSYRYPLHVSADGRHLVDQRSTPFLIKGEAAWLAIVNLSEEEQERYLADREEKGFNLVETMLINANYTAPPNPTPPADRHGERPFRTTGDFASADDRYFDRALAFVDRAARHGIVVLLTPTYLGFDGGHEGWWAALSSPANTRDVCYRYGRFVGDKFKDRPNILWLAGGDYAPPPGSEGEARHWEVLRGMKDAGASQLWTGHWNMAHLGGISTDQARFAPAMNLNGVYQYAEAYRHATRAYDVNPRRPVFLLESAYEREHARTKLQPFRKAWWWTMTSGASGIVWGNNFLWMCQSARGTYQAEYGGTADGTVSSWAVELDSPGTYEALHLHALFEALPWHRLAPAGPATGVPEFVLSGGGSGEGRITAAATPEGDAAVVYVPPTGARARTFRLDLSRLRGVTRARWYDPSTGEYVLVAGATGRERLDLTTLAVNSSGTNDWVLVLDAPDPASPRAGRDQSHDEGGPTPAFRLPSTNSNEVNP